MYYLLSWIHYTSNYLLQKTLIRKSKCVREDHAVSEDLGFVGHPVDQCLGA